MSIASRSRAGSLDRRITIQHPEAAQDAVGEPIITWVDDATVWANINHVAGNERFQSEKFDAEVEKVFTVRWFDAITRQHRIKVETNFFDESGARLVEYYDVLDVEEIGRRWLTRIKATAHVNKVE